MDEEKGVSPEQARHNPDLYPYVRDWGRPGDLGVIAFEPGTQRTLGAAWVRLLASEPRTAAYVDARTPELAIATWPGLCGQGIGTAMLRRLLADAAARHPAIVLTVRASNPAARLYARVGFEIVGEVVNRVGTRSHKMLLRLNSA
nr:K396 [uncultured bacterium]